MKRICVWICVSQFFVSCNNTAVDTNMNEESLRKSGDYPENNANEYDVAGKIYNQLLESYKTAHPDGGDKSKVLLEIESLAYANDDFKALGNNDYIPVNMERIEAILNGRENALQEVILKSKLSVEGKVSIYRFAAAAMIQQTLGPDYDAMHNYILDYEDEVITSNVFTAEDKRIMLTTSSIVRYMTARKRPKKNKDRDWELLVGTFATGIEGGSVNIQNAIIMSATLAVYGEE